MLGVGGAGLPDQHVERCGFQGFKSNAAELAEKLMIRGIMALLLVALLCLLTGTAHSVNNGKLPFSTIPTKILHDIWLSFSC